MEVGDLVEIPPDASSIEKGSTHHDIQSPKQLYSLVHSRFHICFLTYICLDSSGFHIRIPLGDEFLGLICCREVNINKKHVGAFLGKQEGRLEANAATMQ